MDPPQKIEYSRSSKFFIFRGATPHNVCPQMFIDVI